MNCYYHPNHRAVAQCVDCNRGLCVKCASKYTVPICDACNTKRKSHERLMYIKPLVWCVVLFIVGYSLGDLFGDKMFGGYMIMCAYAGWKFINQFCPSVFVWFSLRAIYMFYLLKLGISMLIGFFATPIYLVYCVYKLIRTIV